MIVDDEDGFKALTRRVSREAGLTLDAYKDKCLRRRLLPHRWPRLYRPRRLRR